MCKVQLAEHLEREQIGPSHPELRVMMYEGRLLPITVHIDSLGIFSYTPWQVQLEATGATFEEFQKNVITLLGEAAARGVLEAMEECKMKGAAA